MSQASTAGIGKRKASNAHKGRSGSSRGWGATGVSPQHRKIKALQVENRWARSRCLPTLPQNTGILTFIPLLKWHFDHRNVKFLFSIKPKLEDVKI